jgi:hypothetical protein
MALKNIWIAEKSKIDNLNYSGLIILFGSNEEINNEKWLSLFINMTMT